MMVSDSRSAGETAFEGTSLVPPSGWLTPPDTDSSGCGAWYLLLITGLAAVVRFWRLDAMSLWIDEIFTWNLADPNRGLGIYEMLQAAYQGPLYPVLVRPLLALQESAFLFRLPACAAGVLAAPLLGIFTARLFGRVTGRLSALFLAISPFAVWYSQEGRGYSFLILFSIAAGLVMLSAMRAGPTWRRMLALVLFSFLGISSNNAFLILLVAFGVTVLVAARPLTRNGWMMWGLGLAGGVALSLPWLLNAAGVWEFGRVMPGAALGESLRGETTFTWWALPFTGHAFFYGFSLGPALSELQGLDRMEAVRRELPILIIGGLCATAAVVIGLFRLKRRQVFLLLWISIPLALVILLGIRNIKPFNVRYVATAFPWVLTLAALGVARSCRWVRLTLSSGLCVLFLISLNGYFTGERYAKEDIRGAVAAIAASPIPERPILAPTVAVVVRHYWRGESPVMGMYSEPLIKNNAMADATAKRQLEGLDEAWILWARSWHLDPGHRLPDAVAKHGRLERIHTGPGVAVDLWRRHHPVKEEQ
jgi:mannosyltransferase